MAGHSKWANIKHRKARQDAHKGKIFTKLSREITVAAREGGGDTDTNFNLRMAVQKAKEANMPNSNITRAVKRGTGEIEGFSYEHVMYEGYGPSGIAVLLEILTDNRNRTVSEIRNIFSRNSGSLGENGCVSWMFQRKGSIVIEAKEVKDEEHLIFMVLEAGADDLESEKEGYVVITEPEKLEDVKEKVADGNINIVSAEIIMLPSNVVKIDTAKDAVKALKLLETLENHDDVKSVYTNCEITEEILAQL